MMKRMCVCVVALGLLAPAALQGQANESSIAKEILGLSFSGMPPGMGGGGAPGGAPAGPRDPAQKAAAMVSISKEIAALPPGLGKVKLADALTMASTQGENGPEAMQAAAEVLGASLKEAPQPPGKDGLPPQPYMELAKLERYARIKTSLDSPLLTQAAQILAANEADVAKADFTLKDLNGKKTTLSALKGKIVLVYFFATECGPCHKEMQDLDLINQHYASQGLVIVAITDENPFNVNRAMSRAHFGPPILVDDGGKAGKAFHIDGVPRTFVFDRGGKLVAESLDVCTQRQFFAMLGQAGLQPEGH